MFMLKKIYSRILHKLAMNLTSRKKLSTAHRYYHKSASLGNALSQYIVGMNYFLGRGCLRSGSEALVWFERSSLAGNVDAQFELGMALLDDRDEHWCVGSAAPWVLSHGEISHPVQQGALFPGGIVLKRDEHKAFDWIKSSADQGKAEAQANLGWLYMKGIGCTADNTSAKSWLEVAAVSNIPSAVYGLAELYSGFSGHPVSDDLAFMWLEKAADLGHVSAMFKLGRIYQSKGTLISRDKAVHYLTLASDNGHSAASLELAKLLLKNNDKDSIGIADEKLRFAARRGSVEAPLVLGQLYYAGASHHVDYREAFSWFKISADRGSVTAQFRVACMYAQGRGVAKDLSRAAHSFTKCASAGHALAAYNLGVFHENGEGITQSYSEAVRWYSKAADAGVNEARVRLARVLLCKESGFNQRSAAFALLESAVLAGSVDAELALARLLLDVAVEGNTNPRVAQLLHSAAAKGNLDAAALVISSFVKGLLPPEEVRFAFNTFSESALAGSMRAQLHLAELYEKGVFVPKSLDLAEKWLVIASNNDGAASVMSRSAAHFRLGVFYCKRNLSVDDVRRGIECYILAGREGHVLAQYNLGIMYLKGIGVSCDVNLAVYWLSKYVEQGNELDQVLLDKVYALGYTGVIPSAASPPIHA